MNEAWLAAMKKVWNAEAKAGGAKVTADRARGMKNHGHLVRRADELMAEAKSLREHADKIKRGA